MSITSIPFLLMCALLCILFFVLPHSIQWILLLVFSLYFYTRSGYAAILFLLGAAVLSFYTARWMERENARAKEAVSAQKDRAGKAREREFSKAKKRHRFIWMCVVLFGVWGIAKYSSMVLATVTALSPGADLSGARTLVDRLIVPLGISFYTFNCTGYVIDISRKKYEAENNFFHYLLYVSFFPHIVQGPFSRFDRLGKTLFVPHSFDYDRMGRGMRRMLYGYAQKLIVADKLAPTVTAVMASPANTPGIYLLAAVLGYGIQLYADFSGYMNIMCGLCEILGIELEENFRQPYFAVSIQNYWQRWHMTLGHWYSDYIFYPVSMGKTAQKLGRKARERFGARMGTLIPSYFAMVFVWTLTGLWHGARWTFVVWGWLNFALIVFSMQAAPVYDFLKAKLHINDSRLYWRVFQVVRTVLLVSLLRIFYCSPTVGAALEYIRLMFVPNWGLLRDPAQVLVTSCAGDMAALKYIAAGCVGIFAVDIVNETGWKKSVPAWIRMVAYGLLFCVIVIGAGGGNGAAGGFMYAQF